MSIDKNEKTIETYLDSLVAKAKKSWGGVNVDSYMKNLRDDSPDKEEVKSYRKPMSVSEKQ